LALARTNTLFALVDGKVSFGVRGERQHKYANVEAAQESLPVARANTLPVQEAA